MREQQLDKRFRKKAFMSVGDKNQDRGRRKEDIAEEKRWHR